MNELDPIFRKVDDWIESQYLRPDAALIQALADSDAAGLPEIHVSPNEGQILYLLAKISGAKRILEIGLLGGYSTIFFARAVGENGSVVSLELSQAHAEIARKNLQRAGLHQRVEIRLGPALESLQKMIDSKEPPFDFVFIDADKDNYPKYFDAIMRLVRSGSVIVGDNVVKHGLLIGDVSGNTDFTGLKEFNRLMGTDPRLEAIAIPLIRVKLDGIAVARVK